MNISTGDWLQHGPHAWKVNHTSVQSEWWSKARNVHTYCTVQARTFHTVWKVLGSRMGHTVLRVHRRQQSCVFNDTWRARKLASMSGRQRGSGWWTICHNAVPSVTPDSPRRPQSVCTRQGINETPTRTMNDEWDQGGGSWRLDTGRSDAQISCPLFSPLSSGGHLSNCVSQCSTWLVVSGHKQWKSAWTRQVTPSEKGPSLPAKRGPPSLSGRDMLPWHQTVTRWGALRDY